jgi:hypothetical protein
MIQNDEIRDIGKAAYRKRSLFWKIVDIISNAFRFKKTEKKDVSKNSRYEEGEMLLDDIIDVYCPFYSYDYSSSGGSSFNTQSETDETKRIQNAINKVFKEPRIEN